MAIRDEHIEKSHLFVDSCYFRLLTEPIVAELHKTHENILE